MSKCRAIVVSLLIVCFVGLGSTRLRATDLYADDPQFYQDLIYSENGDYLMAMVWTGSTLAVGFSYVGPGTDYDIWFSSIDGSFSGLGYHQNHWASADIDGSAVVQGDGNFVLYDSGLSSCWSTSTDSYSGSRLNVQNDGNLVVYDSGNTPRWSVF